jgi:hypothetical protein
MYAPPPPLPPQSQFLKTPCPAIEPAALYGFGALPPFHQSVRELKAVLEHPDVAKKMGVGRAINEIFRESDERYVVVSGKCILGVKIKYLRSEVVGAAKFELKVEDLLCE